VDGRRGQAPLAMVGGGQVGAMVLVSAESQNIKVSM
jgi:phosphoribosylaminoimidazole carboxylase (NCAIR synthetase)